MSSNKLLKTVLMKIMVVQSFSKECISSMVKLLAMAQRIKRNTSVTHVSKLNGLDRLSGRSLGESEFKSQYNTRALVESNAGNDIGRLMSLIFLFVCNLP
jgi:hypothetical protein